MELHSLGIDLRKTVLHLAGLDVRGEIVVCRRFSRAQLLQFTGNLRARLIGRAVTQSRAVRVGWGTI
jgi:transposase